MIFAFFCPTPFGVIVLAVATAFFVIVEALR